MKKLLIAIVISSFLFSQSLTKGWYNDSFDVPGTLWTNELEVLGGTLGAGKVLTDDGTGAGIAVWTTPVVGFADPMTTRGDIIYRNPSNITARLGLGANNFVLGSDGTDMSWTDISGVYQPLHASLTSISGLAYVSGSFIKLNSANTYVVRTFSEVRTDLGLVIGTDVQAWDADLDIWALVTPSANGQSLVSSANYASMRGLLDLEAGTDFYSKSAEDTWRNSVDQTEMGYLDGISSFGGSLIDDADATAGRATLGVDVAGTDNSTDVTLNVSATTGGMSIATQEISNRAATNSQTGYMTAALVTNIETNNAKVTNTDDQKIDVFSISGDNVQLSLEDDGEATKTVDISSTTAVAANTAKVTTQWTTVGSGIYYNTGGVHIGGDSDAGDNNLLVDGTVITNSNYVMEGWATGRSVMRATWLNIAVGANPNTNINIDDNESILRGFNSPTITDATNLAASGTSGSFSLSANGQIITMDLTETIIGLLSVVIAADNFNSGDGRAYHVIGNISSGNLELYLLVGGGGIVSWLDMLDTGDSSSITINYVTST